MSESTELPFKNEANVIFDDVLNYYLLIDYLIIFLLVKGK